MHEVTAKKGSQARILLVAMALFAGCLSERYPGEQVMGSFEFTAALTANDCSLSEIGTSYVFDGTFSRERDNSKVWLTVQGVNRGGGFDGQVADSAQEALRQFAACACDTSQVRETVRVALLSQSQLDAVLAGPLRNPDGSDCPVAPLTAEGLPSGDGISRPDTLGNGTFDAVRACGELVEEILPGEGCQCPACTVTYRLTGVAR